MLRRLVSAVLVMLMFAAFLIAAEYKGKITKVDAENKKITVNIDGKDQEFTVTKDTKILSSKGNELKGGLKSKAFGPKRLEKGIQATITTEKKDDKEVVTEVKLAGRKKDN
jgi:hypothetical protein